MKGIKGLLFVLAAALALLVGACAPAAQAPTPTAPPAATKAPASAATVAPAPTVKPTPKELVKLRLAERTPNFNLSFLLMGVEKGYFKEEGLDLEITQMSSSDLVKLMVAGQVDIGMVGTAAAGFAAIAQGADFQMISNENAPRDVMIVKEGINSVKELEGKNFATNTVGSQPYRFAQLIFKKNGVDPAKVNMIVIGDDGARAAAMIGGRVDGTTIGMENMTLVEKTPGIKVLLTVREALPEQSANGVIFAQGKLIRERPQLITAWLTARARGVRYAMEHKDEAVALGMKLLKSEDKAAMERAFDDHMKYKIMYPNMDFTPEQIDTIQTDAIAAGTMKEKLPFDKVANTKFLKEMLAQIGEYKK